MNTQTITAEELIDNVADTLHSDGNYARITGEVYEGSNRLIIVETEFGSLYLDPAEPVEIVV